MKWLSDEALDRLRAAATAPDLAGTRYSLIRQLGRGGMGAVYLAEDATLGRRVALKVLDLPDPSGELTARLLREARVLASLEHPGIVPVHDVGTLADGRVFYTMKFVEGQRLDERADRRLDQGLEGRSDQRLAATDSLPDRLRIFERICEAVAFAHARGVLHRDLKPENIMVGPFGEVLVMDWGVAKILRDAAEGMPADSSGLPPPAAAPGAQKPALAATEHGAVLGTPGYMAPEQARGETKNLDERADVFSLGAILRFLLTGHRPDDATTAAAANEDVGTRGAFAAPRSAGAVPRPLAAMVAKATSADPGGRYANVKELAADVGHYLDGLPVTAYPEGVFERVGRIIWRNRVAAILVFAYLLMRVLLVVLARR
jgi:serine/threonine protein kinase